MEVDPLDLMRPLVDRGIDAVRALITPFTPPRPALVAQAATAMTVVEAEWIAAQAAINEARTTAAGVAGDRQFTFDARRSQVDALRDDVRAVVAAHLDRIASTVEDLETAAEKAALPPRPTAVDETVLAGIKADLRMVLDGQPDGDVPGVLEQLLAGALEEGDDLEAWLLGTSDWPELYLRSRRLDVTVWSAKRPSVIAGAAGPDAATGFAVRLLEVLDAPTGMGGASVAMNGIVRNALNDFTTCTA